jgi:WD40 repeat protein
MSATAQRAHAGAWQALLWGVAVLLSSCAGLTPTQSPMVRLEHVHDFGATRIAFAPDGSRIASGGYQGDVKIWRVPSGAPLASFRPHDDQVTGLAWADATHLISAARDGRLVISPLGGGETSRHTTTGEPITALAYLPSLRRIVVGQADGRIVAYTYPALRPLAEQSLGAEVLALAASPDGAQVAASTSRPEVLVLSAELTGPRPLQAPPASALDLRYAPDGRTLAGGAWFRVLLWDMPSGRLHVEPTEHLGEVISVDISPDGRHIATIGRNTDAQVRLANLATGAVERRLAPHNLCGWAVRISPDGHLLATASEDESVRLYDLTQPYAPTRTIR